MHHRAQQSIPASRSRTSGLIEEGLVLPKNFPQLTTQEHRYAKFVKQLQAENPDAKLTRDIVDAAAKGIIEKQISTKHNDRVSLLIRQVGYSNGTMAGLHRDVLIRRRSRAKSLSGIGPSVEQASRWLWISTQVFLRIYLY